MSYETISKWNKPKNGRWTQGLGTYTLAVAFVIERVECRRDGMVFPLSFMEIPSKYLIKVILKKTSEVHMSGKLLTPLHPPGMLS